MIPDILWTIKTKTGRPGITQGMHLAWYIPCIYGFNRLYSNSKEG
ncbi:hypothetical protein FLA_2714 [Filimonas lacunae]|nr:hypothetical protein FLA_2714 [Filimonas lacunae]